MAVGLKLTMWVGVRMSREEKALLRRAARRHGLRIRAEAKHRGLTLEGRVTMSEYMRKMAVAAARLEVEGNGQAPPSQDLG